MKLRWTERGEEIVGRLVKFGLLLRRVSVEFPLLGCEWSVYLLLIEW
jgi:hypothetical protein